MIQSYWQIRAPALLPTSQLDNDILVPDLEISFAEWPVVRSECPARISVIAR